MLIGGNDEFSEGAMVKFKPVAPVRKPVHHARLWVYYKDRNDLRQVEDAAKKHKMKTGTFARQCIEFAMANMEDKP